MKNKNISGWIALFLCLVCSLFLMNGSGYAAVSKTDGTLTGKVTISGTRTAIPGATITAVGTTGTFTAVTGTTGSYTMSLPPATYTVTCNAEGYVSKTASATLKAGVKTVLNFALLKATVTTGTLTGAVTNSATGTGVSGATVATATGGYSATTDSTGKYTIANITAGTYNVNCTADGFAIQTKSATIASGATTPLNFALISSSATIGSLTATPSTFTELAIPTISLTASVDGTASSYEWSQVSGPKVPLSGSSATTATADVSTLNVAAEATLVFRLTVTGSDGVSASRDVTVAVQPTDMVPFLGTNVQLGGSTTAVAKFTYGGATWSAFNVGNIFKTTPVGMTKGAVYSVVLPGFIFDLDVVSHNGKVYALASCGSAGIALVDISNPTLPALVRTMPVNYYQDGITFTDGGGTIWTGNVIESASASITSVETDGTTLWIGDFDYGIHKTALANLMNGVAEADGTILVDQEIYTLQYAGENPWGGPVSLKLYNGRIFASLGPLGLNIYDAATLGWIGRYNLYTDTARTEDYFGALNVATAVGSDAATGDLFLDDFTGMPDYRQVQYEILVVMKGTGAGATPWADFERNGKWYYKAQDVDIAVQGTRTIAYVAYSLGGVVAIDITNPAAPAYLGYFPAVPVNGPYETNSLPSSILPYEGAGMLKESGVTGVRVSGDRVYLTDHFAGLVILDKASQPDLYWHGSNPPYSNNTNGVADDNVPDYEDVTIYDMSPWDPLDNESLPWAFYQAPCLLATKELNGHGYTLLLNEPVDPTSAGTVDVLEASSAGGFVFVDVTNLTAASMYDRFTIAAYFPTTDEIGAAADGTATQTIALGHSSGIEASAGYLYVSDGPHGVIAFNLNDAQGYPTDSVHVVANTLQDEYPQLVGTEWIYPASHTVRNVFDFARGITWAQCVGNGMRSVSVAGVEAGLGQVGAPYLMKLQRDDLFEHNSDFTVKALPFQDKAYDVEFRGNYAYVADGPNGITIYDVTKDPSRANSGFYVNNVGSNLGEPLLGTASGIELWQNPANARLYAIIASGPYGVGVVDITDPMAMKILKVFEPIKIEDGDIGVADGQAIDVEVIGDKAYFSYDSFGVVCYSMADLIAPVPVGVDPTEIFLKNTSGTVIYDYRPAALGQFKLQYVPGYEDVAGGAVRMDYTQQNGKLYIYAAFGEAGLLKIDYTNPVAPLLVERKDTSAEASDVVIANGRIYVADGSGGLVFFK
ncbi:carboxypeptidase regulatory-like domain-containing protein [Geobacter benzoatilyticus]|uniref:Carboxypeptidase regulatory-like domain-containing protein n=1 Tax=Geobacter benzoatilyticus TaxID=2815309 RepID=A0ABX7Q7L4_9BACT|nr:carboxypeptidase regulatory-like domain-containing protein [Geobacter benzoatilyticus]QSV47060.1 carboxypeptidase regulatory-like domain-containing protein [Geobacter benzoatilyticus]